MWWCSRRALILGLAALPAAGCTLAPVYGPGGAGTLLQNRLRADDPTTPAAHALVARLDDRLGRAQAPEFRLAYRISVSEERGAATPQRTASRVRLLGAVEFTVTRSADGGTATTGRVEHFTAYSTTETPLATRAAAEDAERRLMVILADQIVMRLLATAPRWAGPPGA